MSWLHGLVFRLRSRLRASVVRREHAIEKAFHVDLQTRANAEGDMPVDRAQSSTVLGMIVGDAMRPVLWGTLAGIAGMLSLSRVLRGLVYGVGVTDPVAFAVATATLIVVALLASWLPAYRASRVDPIVVLRGD